MCLYIKNPKEYRPLIAKKDIVIGECTIPQDSEYVFEGDFETYKKGDMESVIRVRSIASSDLILDRILEKAASNSITLFDTMEPKPYRTIEVAKRQNSEEKKSG